MMMRTSVFLVSLLFAATGSAAPLRIVTEAWPPFIYAEEGEIKGADKEITDHLLTQLGYQVSWRLTPWRRGWLSRDQACAVVAPAQHAPEPLPQRAVCARSPGTARATAVREVHSLIDQRVRNDVELPVDVIHRPMDAPLRERVAELGACAEVRPQCRGAASGLPAAEDDHLACDQL